MIRSKRLSVWRHPNALRLGVLASCFAIVMLRSAPAQQPPPAPPAPQQPAPAQPVPQQFQHSDQWEALPKMVLERQFSGPLQDTVVQRLRDPVDGTICYIYLPISAAHSPATASGFFQYGPNVIGSINCMPGQPASAARAAPGRK
jgi:hypothetical protein